MKQNFLFKGEMNNNDINSYSKLTEIFSNTLGKHAPLKFEIISGNKVPFLTKSIKSIK